MKIVKRALTFFISAMLTMSAWADRVSQEDAATVANNFMNAVSSQSGAKKAPAKRMVLKKAAQAEESQFYVYENADGEGWVMVAANDIARPILAYSDEGQFRFDNQPDNIKSWLHGYNKLIKRAEQDGFVAPESTQQEWEQLRKGARRAKATVVVSPLIKTGWDQDSPFWNLCPQKSGTRCLTGCVATAMAQVMNYWQWPKQGTGSHTLKGTSYYVDFSSTTYDWNNMLNKYTNSATSAQKTAVATLMYHCGVAVDMSYNTSANGGSGAYTIDYNGYFSGQGTMCAETALKQFFGYNTSTIKGYYRDGDNSTGMKKWNKTEWIAMLKTELDASRPIMYAGVGCDNVNIESTCYGHSFVCDGYDSDDMFHFNFGWTNSCDGYYDIDILNTDVPGNGGGNGYYSLEQDVIVGIMPPETGHKIVLNGTGCTLTTANEWVKNGNSVTVSVTPTDATYDYTSTTVKLGSTTLNSSNYTLSTDKKTLTIKASAITGDDSNDLTITVVWTKNRYKYEMLGENCTEELEGMVNKNAPLNLTITPASGYTLADAACWEVTMGGNTLTYGTGFTYSGTTFSISSVTGDVEIYAYGGHTVTWSVQGITSTTTFADGATLILPSNPSDCSGEGGKKFVGWTANSTVSGSAPADLFTTAGAKTVTANTTYYAVYATASGSGGSTTATYGFEDTDDATKWDISAAITKDAGAKSTGTYGGIINTNHTYVAYTDKVKVTNFSFQLKRTSNNSNYNVYVETSANGTDWTTAETYGMGTFNNGSFTSKSKDFDGETALYVRFHCYNTTAVRHVDNFSITYGGGTSYSDYSLTCTASEPCSNQVNISKGTPSNGEFSLDQSGLIDNCSIGGLVVTVSDITPAEGYEFGAITQTGIASGVTINQESKTVTYAKDVKGSSTINVTFTEKPTYKICFYDGETKLKEEDLLIGATATPPSNPAGCTDYTFFGWWTETLGTSNTTAHKVTNFNVTDAQNYYAVYSHTTGSGDDPTISKASSIAVGDEVVLVYETGKMELSSFSSSSTIYGIGSSYSTSPSGSYSFNVVTGSSAGTFAFERDGKYWNWSSGNSLNTSTSISESSSWTVSFSSGNAIIANVGTTSRTIQWNTSSPRFACYTSGQADVQLYKISGGDGTTYYTTTKDCTIPTEVTVTFHANYEGADPATATQTIPYDTETALTANSFSRTGYTFLGWATTASGEKVYNDEASVTLTSNIHLYAVWQKNSHDVIFTPAPTGATVTVNGQSTSPQSITYGETVTISVTPDDAYTIESITATDVSLSGEGNTRTFTMPDDDVTVTVIMTPKPTHIIRFFDNGTKVSEQSVVDGQSAVKPSDPTPCDGYSFVGWWTETLAEDNTSAETWVTNFTATKDQDYYAVFCRTESSGGDPSTVTFAKADFSGSGTISASKSGVSVSCVGNIPSGAYVTFSEGNTLTISSTAGNITSIDFTCASNDYTGNMTDVSGLSTTSWSITVNNPGSKTTVRVSSIVVTIGGGSSTTYYTTSCAPCDYKVTLTKGDETNGTFTLNKDDGEYNNCTADFVVTVSNISPADGYYCTGVTAMGGDNVAVTGPDGSGNYTVTYTKGNSVTSTITANFAEIPMYTVTWDVAGTTSTETHYAGVALEGIPAPTSDDCDGLKKFVGWTATANYSSEDTAPDDLFTDPTTKTTPDNNTTTYYAVFAEEEEGGSDGSTYTLVEESLTDWSGNYIIVNYSNNNKAMTNTVSGGEFGSKDIVPSGKQITTTDNTIIWIFEKGTGSNAAKYSVKSKDSGKYAAIGSTSTSGSLNDAASYFEITHYSTSHQNDVAASSGRFFSYYSTNSTFRTYAGTSSGVYLYRSDGSSTTYSGYTTTCGAAISAKNIGWITAAKGQKVKRVINVSAKGFDEATTLTASSGDAQFKVTLGASAVPAGKTGLSTTLTVEYTPTISDNRIADVELTLSAGGITKTITVSGRSLPDEFLAITKKNDTWYALPANMTGGENQYEGVIVTPDDDSEPTMVAVAPSTIVYSLRSADNSRYAENGAYVRMAGNGGKALWGNTTADALTIHNSETIDMANAENYEWSLHTTDGIHYTIANPHHADYESGRVLAFSDKFGLYKTSTEFFLVPTGCNSQPQEVNVSARRADATFSWVSNASSVTIDLYTDEGKTAFAKSATATSVPYYMTDLTEKTHYWFTLTPDGETACAVSGDFETTGPTIDVVEWKVDTVVVFVDKEEHFNPVVIIDGEVEHGAGTGNVATELFFSKYFEGSGSMKLVAIFNGTKEDIDLTNYTIFVRMRGSSGSWSGSTNDVTLDLSGLGSIASGQEIIFFSRPMGTETELTSCSNTFLNDKVTNCSSVESNPRWIECDGTTYKRINFNGNDPIMLRKSGTLIDIIGSEGAAPTSTNCLNSNNERGWAGTVKNMDKGKSPSDPAFDAFYEASSKTPVTTQDSIDLLADFGINLTDDEIDITTARCILFRDKRVVSGDSAVLMNGSTFVTFTIHDSFHSEWSGRSVCMDDAMKTAAGVENDAQATCNSYQDLSEFNYSNYYKDWQTIEDPKTLNEYTHNEETGTYEIPIPNLAQYSCLNIRFQLQNDAGEVVTEAPVQVPIIVTGNHQTIDDIFNEIVKTDGGDPLYDESINRCKTCDVVVLGKGVLTKATDGTTHDVPEVGDVKVYPGGKLIVPTGTSYSVNSLAFRRQEDAVPTADIQGNLNIKADGKNVYFDLRIDPTNWHYISLPYDCNVSDIRFVGEEIKIPILGTDYLLKYYDGEKRAATQSGGCWEMVAPDGVLKKGIGYIFGIPGTGKVQREFRFPMSNTIIDEEKNPEGKIASGVYAYGGDKDMTEVRANHRGWNLIGDPYLLPYSSDIADPVMTGYIVPDYPEDPEEQWDGHYKFDPDPSTNLRYIVEPVDNGRSEYIQVAITDYEMKPFTSYFVQIGGSNPEAEQGVQFNLSAVERSASPIRRAPAEYEEQEDTHPVWCAVNITSPKGEKDETTMLISDKFTDGYDMMDDLVKMRGTYYQYAQITTKPVLASRNNEGEMAFNALPDASAEAGIPLHYFAATQGEYVIAYNDKYGRDEIQAVMLLDKQTNEWHDLMNAPYEFYTNRTDDKDRFVLTVRVERKKEPQITTDIDATSSTDDRPRKILYKDHIYILRGEKIYDITGKEL